MHPLPKVLAMTPTTPSTAPFSEADIEAGAQAIYAVSFAKFKDAMHPEDMGDILDQCREDMKIGIAAALLSAQSAPDVAKAWDDEVEAQIENLRALKPDLVAVDTINWLHKLKNRPRCGTDVAKAEWNYEAIKTAIERAHRVFQFDLRKMLKDGPDYNQAVVDAAHSIAPRTIPNAEVDYLHIQRP